ncbi:nucleotidyltransferase family protein [Acetobacteraceae bacterium B3987]|nr:nucleotidyltransferase family protein [Acetobacteraceae bacterium B3987]
MSISVLILAGSRDGERDPLAQMGNVSHKALLPIQNIPMIERVLHTLEQIPEIERIWVSIERPSLLAHLKDRVTLLQAAPSPSESVAQALDVINTPCLVTTADHALLCPEWVREFITKSRNADVDLTAGIALKSTILQDVPRTKRTYIRLSDMQFSGCNLFWMASPQSKTVVTLWQRLQRYRKKPLRMAMILGLPIILRALTHTLSSKRLEQRIHTLTGARIRLIPLSDGKAAVDVDKPADAILVEQLLSQN